MARLVAARAGTLADVLSRAGARRHKWTPRSLCAIPAGRNPADFSALPIPLTVIATDLHRRRKRIDSGPLRPALAASMAIPGLFRPVAMGARIMVDGGATDPLPFDRLRPADVIVAVDVFGSPARTNDMPSAWESMFTTMLIMGSTIVAASTSTPHPIS